MARQVFFSFHYEMDIWRVNQVRKSGFMQPETGFIDHSLWELAKLRGAQALQSLIDSGLSGASVTAVLIGAETANRPWVQYEVAKSVTDRKGLLGVRIDRLADASGKTGGRGPDPFVQVLGTTHHVPVYEWVADNGYNNFSGWVDQAAARAGR